VTFEDSTAPHDGRRRQERLVLMPGLDGTGICFAPLIRALPPYIPLTVIAYPDDADFSLRDHAEFVARRLSGEGAVLVAESFSGLVALMLLHERPAGVRGVVFSAAFAEPLHSLLIRGASLVPGAPFLAKRLPSWLLGAFLFRSHTDAGLERMLRQALLQMGPAGLRQRANLIAAGYPFLDDRFSVPCLYLQPTRDRVVPGGASDWFGSHFSSFRLTRFDAPHCLLQTRPAECAETITAFIKGLA